MTTGKTHSTHLLIMPACALLCACRALLSRAERFGTTFVDPSKTSRKMAYEARKERMKHEGFVTGMDLFSEVSVSVCEPPCV